MTFKALGTRGQMHICWAQDGVAAGGRLWAGMEQAGWAGEDGPGGWAGQAAGPLIMGQQEKMGALGWAGVDRGLVRQVGWRQLERVVGWTGGFRLGFDWASRQLGWRWENGPAEWVYLASKITLFFIAFISFSSLHIYQFLQSTYKLNYNLVFSIINNSY